MDRGVLGVAVLLRLAQQTKYVLWYGVCLCQHSSSCLYQDLRTSELSHFLSHISIADTGFGSRQVLCVHANVVDCVLKTVLYSTEFSTTLGDDTNSGLDSCNC